MFPFAFNYLSINGIQGCIGLSNLDRNIDSVIMVKISSVVLNIRHFVFSDAVLGAVYHCPCLCMILHIYLAYARKQLLKFLDSPSKQIVYKNNIRNVRKPVVVM